MKKWKCTVCGYIHEGVQPPEICPVCGADRTKFIEITPEETADPKANLPQSPAGRRKTGEGRRFYSLATRWMTDFHAHPMLVHIPNGVLPVCVLFLCLSVFFQLSSLGVAAFYNLIVVFLTMPLVFFSGYIDWKNRFHRKLTHFFLIKIICAVLIFVVSMVLVVWRMVDPGVAGPESDGRFVFLFLHFFILGAAILAGYIGGKLVFRK